MCGSNLEYRSQCWTVNHGSARATRLLSQHACSKLVTCSACARKPCVRMASEVAQHFAQGGSRSTRRLLLRSTASRQKIILRSPAAPHDQAAGRQLLGGARGASGYTARRLATRGTPRPSRRVRTAHTGRLSCFTPSLKVGHQRQAFSVPGPARKTGPERRSLL